MVMNRKSIAVSVFLICIACQSAAWADSAYDCKYIVDKAVAMFKDQGKEAALKAINDPNGPFVKGELYVFAATLQNAIVAHPFEKSLIGLNMSKQKDKDGKEYAMEFKRVAETQGQGWVQYTFSKPNVDKAFVKRSYIARIPGEDLYVGAGYYLE
jgi:cytochrome c